MPRRSRLRWAMLLPLVFLAISARSQDTREFVFPARFSSTTESGAAAGRIVVSLDLSVLRRLVLASEDVRDARLALPFAPDAPVAPAVKIAGSAVPGVTVETKDGICLVGGLGALVRDALAGDGRENEIVLEVGSVADFRLVREGKDTGVAPTLTLVLADHPKAALFDYTPALKPGVYASARNGHLYYGDQRLRIWGTLGAGNPERLRRMGFNGWRMWPTLEKVYTGESAATGAFPSSARGDGGLLDTFDRQWADFKKNGFFIMPTQLIGMMPIGLLAADNSFVSGGSDWEAWRAAIQTKGLRWERLCFVDERLRKARKQHIANFLNHTNPYTGKRYAEDEAAVIWELGNETGFVKQVLDGDYEKWPAYFRDKFREQWREWLKRRHGTNEALQKAWAGGDTLEEVELGPALKQASKYSKARADDFVRFTIELADAHLQELRAWARAQAPRGVGVAVAPFSFDTIYRPSIPWLYSATRGDAATFGMYFWDLRSALSNPPSAYVLDNHTVEGKITVIYETNQGRPNPFRAEFPYRLAALASWQDWDAVFFHYWGARDLASDEQFLITPLPAATKDHYWSAVHHEADPAMTSAMAVAGRMFLNRAIDPAPHPAIYEVGGPGIFSSRFANGLAMARSTFERGSRIRFEPRQDFDLKVDHPASTEPLTEAVRAGDQISWDWPRGRLVIDAPAAKAYVGPVEAGGFRFRDGLTLSGLNTPWVAFGLASAGGEALDRPTRALASAVFDARNSDFEIDWSVSGGPVEQALAIKNRGRAPVVADRVDYTLSFPFERKWTLRAYDFALREIAEETGDSNVIRFRNQDSGQPDSVVNRHPQEDWISAIDLSSPRQAQPAVADANPGAKEPLAVGGTNEADFSDPARTKIWNPLPNLSWGDRYAVAHRKLRDANVPFDSITPPPSGGPAGDAVVTWSNVAVLFNAPANIDVIFKDKVMRKIVVTFIQPPALETVTTDHEKRLGVPVEKKLTSLQYEQSSVRWLVKNPAANLEVLATEAQGILQLTYELKD